MGFRHRIYSGNISATGQKLRRSIGTPGGKLLSPGQGVRRSADGSFGGGGLPGLISG